MTKKHQYVTITRTMALGKTTAAKLLAQYLNWCRIYSTPEVGHFTRHGQTL